MSSTKKDVQTFLTSRRGKITPAMAGLPDYGGKRRVPGLRRTEVAALAGVSLEYYTRLERGNIHGASEGVLNALADALQLNEVERRHLFDLARAVPSGPSTERAREVRGSVRRVLDTMTVPAIVYDARQDIIAADVPGRALYSQHLESDRPNLARFTFLDSRAGHFHADLVQARWNAAAMLRLAAGRDPLDAGLTALIGELSTRSPEFRLDWARQDVHEHRTGPASFRHPEVGALDFTFDVFEMPGEPGLSIKAYSYETPSPTAERMAVLTSWAATYDEEPDRLRSRR